MAKWKECTINEQFGAGTPAVSEATKKLPEDARLAARGKFPTGQAILTECADRIKSLEARIARVYSERTAAAVAMARFALACGYTAGVGKDDNQSWDDEWRVVLYVDTPRGQVSWHIAPEDQPLLVGLPKYEGEWDGTFRSRDGWFSQWEYAGDPVAAARAEGYAQGVRDAAKIVGKEAKDFPDVIAWAVEDLAKAILALLDTDTPAPPSPESAQDVIAERERQKAVEGWTAEHDDGHTNGELALAAGAYALASAFYHSDPYAAVLSVWPWDRKWLKPTDRRRDLIKAGALILAEIERLDRIAQAGKGRPHE